MEDFKYFNNMQDIHSDIYDKLSEKLNEVKSVNVTADDVRRTLGKIKNNEALDHFDYYNMLSDAAIDFIEEKKWDRMMISMYLCFISTASMYYIWKY